VVVGDGDEGGGVEEVREGAGGREEGGASQARWRALYQDKWEGLLALGSVEFKAMGVSRDEEAGRRVGREMDLAL